MNFNEDFIKVTAGNVYPLLAIYDQYIEYDVQKKSYEGYPVETLEAGHVTGSLNTSTIRSHVLKVLNIQRD